MGVAKKEIVIGFHPPHILQLQNMRSLALRGAQSLNHYFAVSSIINFTSAIAHQPPKGIPKKTFSLYRFLQVIQSHSTKLIYFQPLKTLFLSF
jgi:hypothetical protein